jgi:erythronate-4-phosphate dehydrogenase
MIIVADKNIPLVNEAFSGLGELRLVDGRKLGNADLKNAEVLLVRSVSRVDRALLDGSAIKFVGSATSGVDHIDVEYLQQCNIHFAHTPGVNAQAVAEYVISAIVYLARLHKQTLTGKVLAVVGYGHIGKRVVQLAQTLGMHCLINDPPLQDRRQNNGIQYHSLDDVLRQADFVSLHTPLTRSGPYPSYHLLDSTRLGLLQNGASLINTSRGGVVDTQALLPELENDRIKAVLDVWEAEPEINIDLLRKITLGTPHIAGYTLESKLNATAGLHRQLCEIKALQSDWSPPLPLINLALDLPVANLHSALDTLLGQICRLQDDDRYLRRIIDVPAARRAAYFDQQRITYPLRREFSAYRLRSVRNEYVKQQLTNLGFKLDQPVLTARADAK